MARDEDALSMARLSLGYKDVGTDEKLDAVRKSVLAGNVDRFLVTVGDLGDQSPLVYLMDWLHTWQQEYEAFVHVLGMQDETDVQKKALEMENELVDVETEAEQLMTGFANVALALVQRLGVRDLDRVTDRPGWTLLMQAANSGLYELAKELVARNADVNYNSTAKHALNPLYLAVESAHTAVALLLLEKGAIASATRLVTIPSIGAAGEENDDMEDDDCALFQACRFGQVSVVKEMLARGVDVNFSLPSSGDRALHVSVMFGMQKVVELLTDDEKINVNALNNIGQTCLFGCSCVELVELLVARGVDPTIKDADGETALSMAQALGDDEVAAFLETVAR